MRKGIPALLAAALLALIQPTAKASVPDQALAQHVSVSVADKARFPHRLVASHQPAESDLARLQLLLTEYADLPEPENFAALERYLDDEADSPWRLALRLNLGTLYYESGYYSRAIDAFDAAWHQEGNDATAPLVPLRDAAIGELARMHARLGHVEALETLFAEIGDRPLYGSASEAVAGAREGLWHMRNDHGVAYRCGPAALTSIVESAGKGGAATPAISKVTNDALRDLRAYPSGPKGVSMPEVVALADRTGMGLVPARRQGDAEIPLPAVVHWKVSHYAAIVDKRDDLYHVVDPTFGRDQWLTRAALDAESSGMFLVPEGRASDPGWERIAVADTAGYYGRGYLTSVDQDDTREDAPTICPNVGDGTGMCVAKVTTMLVSLRIDDKPVGYAPPVGPAVQTKVSYNQREASQPGSMGFFNIGPKWTLNWLSYVQDRPGSPGSSVKRYASGGGELDYSGYNASTRSFRRELRGGASLVMVSASPVVYERRLADGSKEVYAASNGATTYPRRVFLSRIVDPQGNALSLHYDDAMRLAEVRDALGQSTRFSYEEAANPLLVSSIHDPFGRSARFSYDAMGRLASITDAVGIVSRFTYQGNGTFITRLHTPYGDTSFAATTTGTTRSLEITDPLGHTSRTEFNANAGGFPANDTPPGGLGFQTRYQQYRNTYFWDGEAQARARGNYTMAQVSHWLHNGNIIPAVLESIKAPLESRVWYRREGQSNSIHLGGSVRELPSVTARRLPDGSTQLYRNTHTASGNVTSAIDPLGRELRYDYDATGTDLLAVRRKVGGSFQVIARFSYNSQHRPVTYTDQAGQTWTMQYNGRGQLTSSTNPLGETTSLHYDANGHLVKVVNANGEPAATFTHDAVGRVASATDAGGHTVEYAYDNLDRLVATRYPDGTSTLNTWTNLDLTAVRDRLGRVTRYDYDANRRLVAVTDPAGGVTRRGYDRAGRLVELVDPNGNVTRWERDIQGRVVAKVFPDGTHAKYAYDGVGRLLRETDALGQVRQYAYARDDRPIGVGYSNAVNATPAVGFAWDPWFPRIVRMVDGTGTTQYAYRTTGEEGAGQPAREVTPQGDIHYFYDDLGRMSGRVVNGSEQVFEYDTIGRLVGEGNDLGNFRMGYLGQTAQPVVLELLGGKFNLAFGYEPNSGDRRLKELAYDHGRWSWEFDYETDSAGRLLLEEGFVRGHTARNPLNHERRSFAYDAADRLLAVDGSNASHRERYEPDAADNLLAQSIRDPRARTRNNARNEWVWSAEVNANNQLAATSEGEWKYDAAGNLLDDGQRNYRWDAQHRLIQVANLETGHVTEFAYDGLNRRVRVTELGGTSSTQSTQRFLWCGITLCQKLDNEGQVVARYFGQGEIQGDAPLLYQRDRLGSVRGVVDGQSGEELGSLSYTAFGQASSDGKLPERRFAGMLFHEASGLYLTLYRAYDPEAGRWLSRDPIAEAGGVNLYAYVSGNPVNLIDPFGLCEEEHKYEIKQFTLCSPSAAFNAIKAPLMSAPGAPQAREGFTPNLQLWGNDGKNHISQFVDSSSMTLVNTTLEGHQFHPGTVIWQVTPGPWGVGAMITVTGTGTGPDPLVNNVIGYAFFGPAAAAVAILCGAMPL